MGLNLGIKWGGNYYIDGALAFGLVHCSASIQLAADAIRFIFKKKGLVGIDVNTIDNTISISETKVQTIHAEFTATYGKSRITKHSFQSLLGKLLYVHKCVAPAYMFVNRILQVFRKNSHKKSITLDDELKKRFGLVYALSS